MRRYRRWLLAGVDANYHLRYLDCYLTMHGIRSIGLNSLESLVGAVGLEPTTR